MSIMEHCDYNASLDLIVGFEDRGSYGRTKNLPKYALVFMVCGVLSKWKQPVAFYLSSSQTKSEVIVHLMNEVLQHCHDAGLHVISTVCDMGANNVKAMKSMGSSALQPWIKFRDQKIFTLFDPPHLLKATRNLLLAHNFVIPINLNGDKILGMPSWSHIKEAYNHAAEAILYRTIHHITDIHINPQGRKKMKVSLAAQIFSRSLAVYIEEGFRSGWLPSGAIATASFIGFMDELFDSMNADGKGAAFKPLKGEVGVGSPHFEFWERATILMKDWKMEKQRMEDSISFCPVPRTQNGWLTNLQAFPLICKEIFRSVDNTTKVSTRSFNQDPLENLFGVIRGNCGSNTQPTATQFIGSLKSSVINGLAFSAATTRKNCEEDERILLDSLRSLISSNHVVEDDQEKGSPFHGFLVTILDNEVDSHPILTPVCSQIYRKSDACDQCRSAIVTDSHSPSQELVEVVLAASQLAMTVLDREPHRRKLCFSVVREIEAHFAFQWLQNRYLPHWLVMKEFILQVSVRKTILHWCQNRNRK